MASSIRSESPVPVPVYPLPCFNRRVLAHRFFVAAMIRARPSGLRRRFFLAAFAGAGVAAPAALAFRAAAQRFFCAAGHAPAASTSTGWQLHVQRAGSLRCMRSYQQNPARCDLGPPSSEQEEHWDEA